MMSCGYCKWSEDGVEFFSCQKHPGESEEELSPLGRGLEEIERHQDSLSPAPDLNGRKTVEYMDRLIAEVRRLNGLINTPHIEDFLKAIPLEAAHQRERWEESHDDNKTSWDWFWLIGYLAQKAASAEVQNDTAKALHHTISTSAALFNWYRRLQERLKNEG